MLSSLQPSRPKVNSNESRNPLCQQQIRRHETTQPKSQIEAMPPHKAPAHPPTVPTSAPIPTPIYNPAMMHPVFFTPWRKAPFAVPTSPAFSPVATGYVFENTRRRGSSMTKL